MEITKFWLTISISMWIRYVQCIFVNATTECVGDFFFWCANGHIRILYVKKPSIKTRFVDDVSLMNLG